jgi:hypothetical protein
MLVPMPSSIENRALSVYTKNEEKKIEQNMRSINYFSDFPVMSQLHQARRNSKGSSLGTLEYSQSIIRLQQLEQISVKK